VLVLQQDILVSVKDQVLQQAPGKAAGFSKPETSILIQKCRPYTGNLYSETSGDIKSVFPCCGDVLSCATITCTFAVTFAACWTSGAVAYFSKLFTIEEAESRKVEAVKFVGSLQTGNETEVIAAYKVIS